MRHSTPNRRASGKYSTNRPFGLEKLEPRNLLSVSPTKLPMAADGDEPGFFVVDHAEIATDPNVGFENQIRIRFSESVDSLPTDAIEVVSPTGEVISAAVARLNATDWSIQFPSNEFAGTYALSVSPWGMVADVEPLNQDRDDTAGEPGDDVYRFSSKIATPISASFPHFEDFEPNGLNSPAAWQFTSTAPFGSDLPFEAHEPGNQDPNYESEDGNHALRFVHGEINSFWGSFPANDQIAEIVIDLSGQESVEHLTLSYVSDNVEVEISDSGEAWFPMEIGKTVQGEGLPEIHLDVRSMMEVYDIAFDDAVHFRFRSKISGWETPTDEIASGLLDQIHFHDADRIGPYVQDQQWHVDINGSFTGVEVQFDEPVNFETVASNQVNILNPLGLPIALAPTVEVVGNQTVKYTFVAPTDIGGQYTLSFPSAMDIHGNTINQSQNASFFAVDHSVTHARPIQGQVTVPHHEDFEDAIGFAGWSFANTVLEDGNDGKRLVLGESPFLTPNEPVVLNLDFSEADPANLMLGFRGDIKNQLIVFAGNDETSKAPIAHINPGLAAFYGTVAVDLGALLIANGIDLNDSVYLGLWRDYTSRWDLDDLFIGDFDVSGAHVTDTRLLSNQFTIEFSEPIDPTSFSIEDVRVTSLELGSSAVVFDDTPVWTDDGRTVVLTTAESLTGEYSFLVRNQILDLAGNTLNQDRDLFSGPFPRADSLSGRITAKVFALGDLNLDDRIDRDDVDLLCSAIHANAANLAGDLNGDSNVGTTDLEMLLHNSLGVPNGDLDLTGHINNNDFQRLRDSLFSTAATWSDGDVNCDGTVDGSDFNILAANRFTANAFARNARIPRAAPTNPIGPSPADDQASVTPAQVQPPDSTHRSNWRSESLNRRFNLEPNENPSTTGSVFATLAQRPGLSVDLIGRRFGTFR